MTRQPSLFESDRLTMDDSLALTARSLSAYGEQYDHWALAFSGGKDSSAALTATIHLIRQGLVKAPKTLTILRSDTRMEQPPLDVTARKIMDEVITAGHRAITVLPLMDKRFFVYMFGRGVPPPSNSFRWCTGQLKVAPMEAELLALRKSYGKKFLMLTGVRIGESAARDARIAVACGKNNSECGQGWFAESTPDHVADTLAPLLHWRLCHVWDWLTIFAGEHGFSTPLIASVYGQDENLETHARTGCVGCNLASHDFALEQIVSRPQWACYAPLLELRAVYADLKKPRNRLRKSGTALERRVDGSLVSNPCRMGPLTLAARRWGLDRVKDIQTRAGVDLINLEEEARIVELIQANTWPDGWDGTEPLASLPFENVFRDGSTQGEIEFSEGPE